MLDRGPSSRRDVVGLFEAYYLFEGVSKFLGGVVVNERVHDGVRVGQAVEKKPHHLEELTVVWWDEKLGRKVKYGERKLRKEWDRMEKRRETEKKK